MDRIKEALALIKNGQFRLLLKKVKIFLRYRLYLLREQCEDRRFGGISAHIKKPSRFAHLGSKATESTNYVWLDKIFRSMPLKKEDVFVDVGCGEGRVLTYLYSRGFRGKITGIELDPQVAAVARKRTANCPNITVCDTNVLQAGEFLKTATAIYLFNPFNEQVLTAFVALLEEVCLHPVKIYYCNDVYRNMLDNRKNWSILRRDVLYGPGLPPHCYTVYRYHPEEKQS